METHHYYMYNKPFGQVCARRDERFPTVMEAFASLHLPGLTHVGRLDRQTTGLLLVTDDGAWCRQMLEPAMGKEKEYEFLVMGTLEEEKLQRLCAGLTLSYGARESEAVQTRPARVRVLETGVLSDVLETLHPEVRERLRGNRPDQSVVRGRMVLTEGRRHQVRRMLKEVGCYCIALHRLRVGAYVLGDLEPGCFAAVEPGKATMEP